jgi:hypothetical protein
MHHMHNPGTKHRQHKGICLMHDIYTHICMYLIRHESSEYVKLIYLCNVLAALYQCSCTFPVLPDSITLVMLVKYFIYEVPNYEVFSILFSPPP